MLRLKGQRSRLSVAEAHAMDKPDDEDAASSDSGVPLSPQLCHKRGAHMAHLPGLSDDAQRTSYIALLMDQIESGSYCVDSRALARACLSVSSFRSLLLLDLERLQDADWDV